MQEKMRVWVIAVCICLGSVLYAKPGDLDRTFDNDGKVTTAVSSDTDYIKGIAIQKDGKIVVAGSSNNGRNYDFAIARYDSNGSLDSTFDTDGIVTMHIGNIDESNEASSVAIQKDGKIIVSGSVNSRDNTIRWYFATARYESNGTLDSTFDGDGIAATNFGSGGDMTHSVAIQNDGKIVVAGRYQKNRTDTDFAIVRYDSNGSLDRMFNGEGNVTTDFAGFHDEVYSIAIQNDGKIVAAGYSVVSRENKNFAIARYESNGTLDSTFDGDGKVTTDFGSNTDRAYSVAVQKDGKIVVAGESSNGDDFDFAIARYNSDGSLDSTFGVGGKVTTDFGGNDDEVHSVAIQENGKIIAVGSSYSESSGNTQFAIVRYNSNGTLDNTFGIGGKVTTDFGNEEDTAECVAIQKDGKIVAAGNKSDNNGVDDFALVRYLGDFTAFPPIYYLLQ